MNPNELIEAHRISVDISVDSFCDPAWNSCKPIQLTYYWSGKPAPASRYAEARLLWSSSALYVRFICPQAEPLIISSSPQIEQKTLELWDRDVCEIFIAPDPSAPNHYFEFEGAPTGEWVDLAIQKTSKGRETDFNFESGMSAAGRITFDRVFVALKIPWSESIPQPQPNTKWRVNLFRCVGGDPDRGYVTWRPTFTPEPSFHAPEAFGWLLFTDER